MWRIQRQWSHFLMRCARIAKWLGFWNFWNYLYRRACDHYDATLVPESAEWDRKASREHNGN